MTELNKLQSWLLDHKVSHERCDKYPDVAIKKYLEAHNAMHMLEQFERHQIVVYREDGSRWFDAIYHWGSYGYESGLLEIMFEDDEDVIGWLTAEQVIAKMEG